MNTGAKTFEGFCAEQNNLTGWVFERRRRRILCTCEEIITRPFFRRKGGLWIQDFVITPEALEQGGSEMRTPAETFDTIRTRRRRAESLGGHSIFWPWLRRS